MYELQYVCHVCLFVLIYIYLSVCFSVLLYLSSLSISLSFFLSVCLPGCLSVCLFLHVYVFVFLSVCLSVFRYICLPASLSVSRLSVYPPACLCVCLSVCFISLFLSLSLSVCMSVYQPEAPRKWPSRVNIYFLSSGFTRVEPQKKKIPGALRVLATEAKGTVAPTLIGVLPSLAGGSKRGTWFPLWWKQQRGVGSWYWQLQL